MIGSDRNTERTRRSSFVDLEPVDLFFPDGFSSVISGRAVAGDLLLERGLPRGDSVGISIRGVNGGVAMLEEKQTKTKIMFCMF